MLESIDLSTYGLERVYLNYAMVASRTAAGIALESTESEIYLQNSNLRGYHGDASQNDPLSEIIAAFNDRFFSD